MHTLTPTPEPKKTVTITLSRETIVNGVLGLQLVLMVVFGWQLFTLKQQLGNAEVGDVLAKAKVQPSGDAGGQDAAPSGPVDITVTTADHIRGGKDAKVTIVEYSDFECPFCSRAHPTVMQVLEEYGDDVRVVYRHFPLSFHPQAQKAGEASECAADQGKFWQYHDVMFENQSLVSGGVTQFKKWAVELGLNATRFNNCLDSGEKASLVTDDANEGAALGVTGTPGFFINGISVVGAQPFSVFKQVIDAELAKS